MKIIIQPNQNVINILNGYQLYVKTKKYRYNKYCIQQKIDDGILIFNTITGTLVFLSEVEVNNLDFVNPCIYTDFLIKNWFLVPENFDEDAVISTIREKQQRIINDTYLDHPKGFTILTTSTCNARCFYCYEKNMKNKTHMTMEVAQKVAQYIIDRTPQYGEICLDWFGGEPLINTKVINYISTKVQAAGIKYYSTMISNGYLFDDDLIKKAKETWHLRNVQITLDGTEEIYNKTKAYIYKDCDSPFKRVISNIHKLINANIGVSIRINIDKHNYDNLKELADYLYAEFGDDESVKAYAHPVFEEGFKRSEEEQKIIYNNLMNIEQYMEDIGIFGGRGLHIGVKYSHCMADNGDHICIFPKGDLGVCEHYLDKYHTGHIDNPDDKNWEILQSWKQFTINGCINCVLKPICLKTEKCPDESFCTPYQREHDIFLAKLQMVKSYKDFLKNPPKDNCKMNCQKCERYGN